MSFNVIDIFSGAGGMSKGIIDSGLNLVAAVDIDSKANKINEKNNNIEVIEADIFELNISEIPQFDILCSSLPVHQFSIVASYTKNIMLSKLLEIIESRRPKAFLLETVKGFASQKSQVRFNKFLIELNNLGYSVSYEILSDSNHGGIPHNRERLYIVGSKIDLGSAQHIFPSESSLCASIDDIIDFNVRANESLYLQTDLYNEDLHQNYGVYRVVFSDKRKELKRVAYKSRNGISIFPTMVSSELIRNRLVVRDKFGFRKFSIDEVARITSMNEIKIDDDYKRSEKLKYYGNLSSSKIVSMILSNLSYVLQNGQFIHDFQIDDSKDAKEINEMDNDSIRILENQNTKIPEIVLSESDLLIKKLNECIPGCSDWKKYEDLCFDAFSYVFKDGFGNYIHASQVSNESGNDVRDFIIANDGLHRFWKDLKSTYSCHNIVIECKNYSESIDNNVFRQISDYLSKHVNGQFGIVFTRKKLTDQARKKQISYLTDTTRKLILVITDDDLIELIKMRDAGQEPETLLMNLKIVLDTSVN